MSNLSSYFFVIAPIFVFLAVFLIFIYLRYNKKNIFKRALSYTLYEVSFPRTKIEQGKTFQDMIAIMEQFYAGMSVIKPHFTVELVSPATENETNFYVSVPRDNASVFEKQIRFVFPFAELREETSDYNIFKYDAYNLASTITLKEDDAFPLRTYEEFDADPLEIIANTFAGLDRETEGAALQIVINPGWNNLKDDIAKAIKFLQSGESLEAALRGGGSFLKSLVEVIAGGRIHKELPREGIFQKDDIIKQLNNKVSKQIMQTNIRLVVSAQSEERAQSILNEMKSIFVQFGNPQGNSIQFQNLRGKFLKNFLYNFSWRYFNKRHVAYLNTAELTSLYHFPSYEMTAPKMKFLKARKAEPPVELPKEGILIGKNSFRGKETNVYITTEDRRRHFYVVGQTGTGKSVFIKNMLLQDIKAGHGVCFIDPHGDAVEEILGQIPEERMEDVVYFDPGDVSRPLGLNMLEYDRAKPEQRTIIVNELLEIFNKLYDMSTAGGPMFEQYFRNAALLVMEDPDTGNTLLEISRVLSDKEFRRMKLLHSKNSVVNTFWTDIAEKARGEASLESMVPYITNKFDTFLSNEMLRPILTQEKSSIDFREIMDSGKILLVNLSKGRLGEINAHLLGMFVVGKLFISAMTRVDIPEERRKDFYFYIDEFQNVTTKSISAILSEARKYRLSLIVGHQFIGQLSEEISRAVFGNVGSLAVFRVGKEDAEYLKKHFEPVFEEEDLMRIPNYNAYLKLLINGQASRPFNMETFPPESSNPKIAERSKSASAIKYGCPLREIESEINQRRIRSFQ